MSKNFLQEHFIKTKAPNAYANPSLKVLDIQSKLKVKKRGIDL